jgi:hypothetical protein
MLKKLLLMWTRWIAAVVAAALVESRWAAHGC